MLAGVVIFLLLLLALSAIPLTLSFQISWHQALQGQLRLLWLFGLVRFPIQLPPHSSTSSDSNIPSPKNRPPQPTGRKEPRALSLLHDKPLRRRIMRFIRDFWRAIGKKELNLRLRLGLGDPADTGQLWAFVGPIAGVLASTRSASVEIEPDFFATTLELDGSGEVQVIPLQMLYLALGLLLSTPMRRALKQMRRSHPQ